MFDRLWRKDLTQAEALELMEAGVAEVTAPLPAPPLERSYLNSAYFKSYGQWDHSSMAVI